jgi:CRP/FNR family transcriptional regulator, cyclic AMP receptor protein
MSGLTEATPRANHPRAPKLGLAQPRAAAIYSLMDLDPDLGRLLHGERLAHATVELRVRLHSLPRGPWPLTAVPSPATTHHLGLLVLDGVLASDVLLEDVVSTELLGAGDILRPWPTDDPERMLGDKTRWTVLANCRVAVLDHRFAGALSRFPEVYGVLLERMDRRARRLATTQAISELTRVDRRLLGMFWHLAERWGRITAEGVVIPLDVSHRLLGQLVGARRPTVSTALAELARDGQVQRRSDGGWLLRGEPTGMPESAGETLLSRRRLMTDERRHVSPSGR